MTDTITIKRSKLAAKVAETVMGWGIDGNAWLDPQGELAAWSRGQGRWDPTTDANHMLEVVERLRELGWAWHPSNASDKWDVILNDVFSDRPLHEARDLVDAIRCSHPKIGVATCASAIEAVTGKRVELED